MVTAIKSDCKNVHMQLSSPLYLQKYAHDYFKRKTLLSGIATKWWRSNARRRRLFISSSISWPISTCKRIFCWGVNKIVVVQVPCKAVRPGTGGYPTIRLVTLAANAAESRIYSLEGLLIDKQSAWVSRRQTARSKAFHSLAHSKLGREVRRACRRDPKVTRRNFALGDEHSSLQVQIGAGKCQKTVHRSKDRGRQMNIIHFNTGGLNKANPGLNRCARKNRR